MICILIIMKQLPNILSIIRIILAPVFVVMYLQDELLWRSLSVAVFAAAAVTDFFDGYIARHYHAETDYGVFLDPLADKILTFAGFICLPFVFPEYVPWWAIGLIVLRDVFVTLLRVVADKKNHPMKTRYTAKIKTGAQMLFLYSTLLFGVFIQSNVKMGAISKAIIDSGTIEYLLYLIVAITLYTGIEYAAINRRLFGRTP